MNEFSFSGGKGRWQLWSFALGLQWDVDSLLWMGVAEPGHLAGV